MYYFHLHCVFVNFGIIIMWSNYLIKYVYLMMNHFVDYII